MSLCQGVKTQSALACEFPLGSLTGRLLVLPPVDCISLPKQQAQSHKHTYLMKALQSPLLLANSRPQLALPYYVKQWINLLDDIRSLTEILGDESLSHLTAKFHCKKQVGSMTARVSAQDEQLGLPGCFAPYHRQPTP